MQSEVREVGTRWLILCVGLLLGKGFVAAQDKPGLDLRLDHLAGPVRSALTKRSYSRPVVVLPNGPTVIDVVMRDHAEYDPEGNRTLGENQQKGGPYGESMMIGRDAEGGLYDRRTVDLQTGVTVRYERFGPHGVIDDLRYSGAGKLTNEFIQGWDENGRRSTWVGKDGDGKEVSHRRTTFTADGVLTEETSWRADGMMDWSETFEPATGVSQVRGYDENGKLRLSSTAIHDRLVSFWSSEKGRYLNSYEMKSGRHRDVSMCKGEGICDHLNYEYVDEDQRNPRSVELRDSTDALKAGAYYDYTLDVHGNWTSRTIRVKIPDEQQPRLYEEDARTLVYWPGR